MVFYVLVIGFPVLVVLSVIVVLVVYCFKKSKRSEVLRNSNAPDAIAL